MKTKNWLKKKLRDWLVPDYEKIDSLMQEITKAKRELQLADKNITFEEPVVFLGSLHYCKINVKPTLKPEITLAKLDIPAGGLMASGIRQLITGCYFHQEPTTIKLNTEKKDRR